MADDEREETVILKAIYTAVAGSNVEYGQGAIEHNELEHCEIEPSVWLIRVPAPGDPVEWRRKLDAYVDPEHGRFLVEWPTADELRRVASGELMFQK